MIVCSVDFFFKSDQTILWFTQAVNKIRTLQLLHLYKSPCSPVRPKSNEQTRQRRDSLEGCDVLGRCEGED